jgi:hypothetical protein
MTYRSARVAFARRAILANLHAGAAALAQADDGVDVVNRVARRVRGTCYEINRNSRRNRDASAYVTKYCVHPAGLNASK